MNPRSRPSYRVIYTVHGPSGAEDFTSLRKANDFAAALAADGYDDCEITSEPYYTLAGLRREIAERREISEQKAGVAS